MIVTVSELDFTALSVTVSWNVRVLALPSVNVGCSAVESDNVTEVPPICVHENVKVYPSGSVLLEPSSVTSTPVEAEGWSGPALVLRNTLCRERKGEGAFRAESFHRYPAAALQPRRDPAGA